ncbi:MAG: hypothetical protein QXP74_04885 [Nitrososphaerota archaeon]
MKRNKKAISAIIGTAIALTIVFAIIIPLFLYMQSLQTLFMQEANRRLQYELERLNERLEVYTTICGGWGTSELEICAVVFNPGILSASIPTIYIESYRYGLLVREGSWIIIPGQRVVIDNLRIAFNPGVDDTVRVKFITLRGNSFVSKNTIGLRNLPYTLAILVKNMTVGYKYEVKVEIVGEYGCVSENIEQVCQAFGTHELIPQTSLDRDAVITFMVAPGNYTISIRVYDYMNKQLVSFYRTQPIEILNDIVVRLDAYHQPPSLEKIPLRLRSTIPNYVTVIMKGETETIDIPYAVSLGNQSEPLRDVEIKIAVSLSGLNLEQDFTSTKKISRILPGETYFDVLQITVKDDAGGNAIKFGGSITYRIELSNATTEISGRSYSGPSGFEVPSIIGEIILCRVNLTEILEGQIYPLLLCEASGP